MRQSGYEAEAGIFEAHTLILEDPVLLEEVKARIFAEKASAAPAWRQALQKIAERYRGLEDEYMQARAADVEDVAHRVLRHLLQEASARFDLEEPSILVAADLTPSDTAQIDPDRLLAFCTRLGGATSHSAILARAMGIPAVVGLGPALQQIRDGQRIAIDGQRGWVWPDPGPQELRELQAQKRQWLEEKASAREAALEPARTGDGKRIEVAANIGSVEEARIALQNGAEGVGLFRTEFLFLNRQSAPSESEQFDTYRQVATLMEDRPLIIRTLDVGGDKPLPYADMEQEANPFLGSRGIRYCLDQPQFFLPQLRAILRAGAGYDVRIMFPMISTVGELRSANQLLDQAREELRSEGATFSDDMNVGVMIEVPSAVAMADRLAQTVDFFSIGTNDLTQYVMAADRGNRQVASLADALQPAVLRMIRQTVEAAHQAGIWVGMCGELAGNPLATSLLVGVGLDELSMNSPSIPQVKAAIRRVNTRQAGELAEAVLDAESASQVTALLQEARGSNDTS
jgi:phosphocarrier protein FPr